MDSPVVFKVTAHRVAAASKERSVTRLPDISDRESQHAERTAQQRKRRRRLQLVQVASPRSKIMKAVSAKRHDAANTPVKASSPNTLVIVQWLGHCVVDATALVRFLVGAI